MRDCGRGRGGGGKRGERGSRRETRAEWGGRGAAGPGDRGPLERARTWSSVIITTPGITAPPEESPRWLPPPISSRVRRRSNSAPTDGCLSFFGASGLRASPSVGDRAPRTRASASASRLDDSTGSRDGQRSTPTSPRAARDCAPSGGGRPIREKTTERRSVIFRVLLKVSANPKKVTRNGIITSRDNFLTGLHTPRNADSRYEYTSKRARFTPRSNLPCSPRSRSSAPPGPP